MLCVMGLGLGKGLPPGTSVELQNSNVGWRGLVIRLRVSWPRLEAGCWVVLGQCAPAGGTKSLGGLLIITHGSVTG